MMHSAVYHPRSVTDIGNSLPHASATAIGALWSWHQYFCRCITDIVLDIVSRGSD